jgi:hypothetical protein
MDTEGYWIREGKVYYNTWRCKGADAKSFEVLNDIWAKDSKRLFCVGLRLMSADHDTFRVLNDLYARDKDNIFYLGGIAKKVADPATFEVLDSGSMDTPWHWKSYCGYARDSRHVYFYEPSKSSYPHVMRGADPATFRVLEHGYGTDGKSVYCNDTRIDGADPATFAQINYFFARDANHVFYLSRLLPDADLESFAIISAYCAKDRNRVYLQDKVIESADSETFVTLDCGFVGRDRNHVFIHGKVVREVDLETFAALGRSYYRDKDHIYFLDYASDPLYVVKEADMETFEILPVLSPEQKRAYWRGELQVEHPEAVDDFYAIDAKRKYRAKYSEPRK